MIHQEILLLLIGKTWFLKQKKKEALLTFLGIFITEYSLALTETEETHIQPTRIRGRKALLGKNMMTFQMTKIYEPPF